MKLCLAEEKPCKRNFGIDKCNLILARGKKENVLSHNLKFVFAANFSAFFCCVFLLSFKY